MVTSTVGPCWPTRAAQWSSWTQPEVVLAVLPSAPDPVADVAEPDGFVESEPVVDEASPPEPTTSAVVGVPASPASSEADDEAADPSGVVVGIGQVVELVPASTVASEPVVVSLR